jgi:hypothetical protein
MYHVFHGLLAASAEYVCDVEAATSFPMREFDAVGDFDGPHVAQTYHVFHAFPAFQQSMYATLKLPRF